MVSISRPSFMIEVPRPNLAPYVQAQALAAQGYQNALAQGLSGVGEALAAGIQAERQREREVALQQRFAARVKAFQDAPIDKRGEAFGLLVAEFPQAKEQLKAVYDGMSDDERKAQLDVVSPVLSLLQVGEIGLAKERLQMRLAALQNEPQKNAASISRVQGLLKSIDAGPKGIGAVVNDLTVFKGSLLDVKEFDKWMAQVAAQPFAGPTAGAKAGQEEAKRGQEEAKRTVEEARAGRIGEVISSELGLTAAQTAELRARAKKHSSDIAVNEAQLLAQAMKEGAETFATDAYSSMTGPEKMLVNGNYTDAAKQRLSASKIGSLADKIEAMGDTPAGIEAAVREAFKEVLGNEDLTTFLSKQYGATRAAAAVAQLRGTGPMSNKELEVFMSGWPGANANKDIKVAYLRAAQKIASMDADIAAASGAFLAGNGTLAPARRSMIVRGMRVPAGHDFDQFAEEYLYPQMLSRYFPDDATQQDVADGFVRP